MHDGSMAALQGPASPSGTMHLTADLQGDGVAAGAGAAVEVLVPAAHAAYAALCAVELVFAEVVVKETAGQAGVGAKGHVAGAAALSQRLLQLAEGAHHLLYRPPVQLVPLLGLLQPTTTPDYLLSMQTVIFTPTNSRVQQARRFVGQALTRSLEVLASLAKMAAPIDFATASCYHQHTYACSVCSHAVPPPSPAELSTVRR